MADSEFQRRRQKYQCAPVTIYSTGLDVQRHARRMDEDDAGKGVMQQRCAVYGYIDYLAMNILPDLYDESRHSAACCDETVSRKGPRLLAGICAQKVSAMAW